MLCANCKNREGTIPGEFRYTGKNVVPHKTNVERVMLCKWCAGWVTRKGGHIRWKLDIVKAVEGSPS